MTPGRRFRNVSTALLASLALAGAAAAQGRATARLDGRLVLLESGRPVGERAADRTHAAVWFEPARAAGAPAAVAAEMATEKKQFRPQLVVVPVGSSVNFTNFDPILHNAFSVSGKNAFDLGLVGAGKGKAVTFREAGLVRVFCNVHHGMFAHVLVVATPHYAQPDRQGRFRLDGLPPGPGTLHFWHERAEPGSRAVVVPAGGELEVEVELTLPRVPPHKNKFGKPYARGAYE